MDFVTSVYHKSWCDNVDTLLTSMSVRPTRAIKWIETRSVFQKFRDVEIILVTFSSLVELIEINQQARYLLLEGVWIWRNWISYTSRFSSCDFQAAHDTLFKGFLRDPEGT